MEEARFILKERLTMHCYSGIQLSDAEAEAIAKEDVAEPLPSGLRRVGVLTMRIRKSLETLNRAQRTVLADESKPAKPKVPRFRRSLTYDYRKPVAPSKAVEQPLPLIEEKYNAECYPSPEDLRLELETYQGSENEDAHQEQRQVEPVRTVLERAPQSCGNCGERIPPEQPRSAIVRISQSTLEDIGSMELIALYCDKCRGTEVPGCNGPVGPRHDESWALSLSAKEREACDLRKQGFNQTAIGARMNPRRSQAAVSRILRRVDEKHQTALREKLHRTGGA